MEDEGHTTVVLSLTHATADGDVTETLEYLAAPGTKLVLNNVLRRGDAGDVVAVGTRVVHLGDVVAIDAEEGGEPAPNSRSAQAGQ